MPALTTVLKDTLKGSDEEGTLTKAIERQTAKVPSGAYLTLALASAAVSLGLTTFSQKKELANFLGLWVPTILIIGLYNKLVKLHGSER